MCARVRRRRCARISPCRFPANRTRQENSRERCAVAHDPHREWFAGADRDRVVLRNDLQREAERPRPRRIAFRATGAARRSSHASGVRLDPFVSSGERRPVGSCAEFRRRVNLAEVLVDLVGREHQRFRCQVDADRGEAGCRRRPLVAERSRRSARLGKRRPRRQAVPMRTTARTTRDESIATSSFGNASPLVSVNTTGCPTGTFARVGNQPRAAMRGGDSRDEQSRGERRERASLTAHECARSGGQGSGRGLKPTHIS